MTIQDYLVDLKNKPMFYVMFCPDAELRPIYIKKFLDAHGGKPVYKDSMDIGKQPRVIGAKPVYVVLDWDPGLKKPDVKYSKVTYPTLLVYTKKGAPSEAVKQAYKDFLVVVPEVTGEQATNLLRKLGLDDTLIEYLKAKTDSTQEAILLGRQIVSLSNELKMSTSECFEAYFKKALVGRNIDEEPTEFLANLLGGNASAIFDYLLSQRGNELFVYAALLNWLDDIIRFCSCNGQYWEDAGLVAAKYKPFRAAGVSRTPFLVYAKLYAEGVRSIQAIKINEADPGTALEVFVCRIIQTLKGQNLL